MAQPATGMQLMPSTSGAMHELQPTMVHQGGPYMHQTPDGQNIYVSQPQGVQQYHHHHHHPQLQAPVQHQAAAPNQPHYQIQANNTVTYHQMQTPQQQRQPQPHVVHQQPVYLHHQPQPHVQHAHPQSVAPPTYVTDNATQNTYIQLNSTTRMVRAPVHPTAPQYHQPAEASPSVAGPRIVFKGHPEQFQRMLQNQQPGNQAPNRPMAPNTLRPGTKIVMLKTASGALRPMGGVRASHVPHPGQRPMTPPRVPMPHPVVSHGSPMASHPHVPMAPQPPRPPPQTNWRVDAQPHPHPAPPQPMPPTPRVLVNRPVVSAPQYQPAPNTAPQVHMNRAPPTGAQSTQSDSDIAYNVEHIFIEEGKEVSKMPIKIGDSTFWVDCVSDPPPQDATANSISFELDASVAPTPQSQPRFEPNAQLLQPQIPAASEPAAVPKKQFRPNKDISQEERDQCIKKVVEEQISPGIVAEEIGVTASTVRGWIKHAGLTLPTKYKQTHQKKAPPTKEGVSPGPVETQQPLPPAMTAPTTPVMPPNQPQFSGPSQYQGQQPVDTSQNQMYGPRAPHPQGMAGQHPRLAPSAGPNSLPGLGHMGQLRPNGPQFRPTGPGLVLRPEGMEAINGPGSPITPVRPITPALLTTAPNQPTLEAAKPVEKYVPRYVPGKLKLCRNCGSTSADFNRCEACRKPLPDDCKIVNDHNQKLSSDVMHKHVPTDGAGSEGGKLELRGVRINHNKRKKKAPDEPVCIALSSDEDDDGEDQPDGGASQPSVSESPAANTESRVEEVPDVAIGVDAGSISSTKESWVSLPCRSVRVGSYKAAPKDRIVFTMKGFQVKVPGFGSQADAVMGLNIRMSEVLKVLVHFGKNMPAMFFFITPGACERIRKIMGMYDPQGYWFDIKSGDETMKRITILPERLRDEDKSVLGALFQSNLDELDSKGTNELLVKCSPRDINMMKAKMAASSAASNALPGGTTADGLGMRRLLEPAPIMKYCQFPLTGANSVSVGTEDYICLEEDSFLNDVIIDFYFRWLQFQMLEVVDRDRTHIFSTFFYKRLTTRPKKMKNRIHPVEDNPNLSAADKRYERVKRWTKKVDIFNKDFIFVPINEQSHWFLAVICYPGLMGCRSMKDDSPLETPESQKLTPNPNKGKPQKKEEKKILQIGSTSIIPLKGASSDKLILGNDEDTSDRDEAEASDDDMMDEDEDFVRRMALPSPEKPDSKAQKPPVNDKVATAEAKVGSSEKLEKMEGKNHLESTDESEEEEMKDGTLKLEESDPEDTGKAASGQDDAKQVTQKDTLPTTSTPESDSKSDEATPEDKAPKALVNASKESSDPVPSSPEANRPSIKQPCILIFDSLNTGSRARVAATLRDYLTCEYKDKKGEERVFTRENTKGNCPKVPQQPNFSDCGIFVLQYAQSFFENPIEDFTLPITSLRNWFASDTVRGKRGEIGEIIRNLAKEQNPNKSIVFPDISFNPVGYSDDEDMTDEYDEERRTTPTASIPVSNGIQSPSVSTMSSISATSATKVVTVSGGMSTPSKLICLPIMKKDAKLLGSKVSSSPGMVITKKAGNVTLTRFENGAPSSVRVVTTMAAKTLKVPVTDKSVTSSPLLRRADVSAGPELKKAKLSPESSKPAMADMTSPIGSANPGSPTTNGPSASSSTPKDSTPSQESSSTSLSNETSSPEGGTKASEAMDTDSSVSSSSTGQTSSQNGPPTESGPVS